MDEQFLTGCVANEWQWGEAIWTSSDHSLTPRSSRSTLLQNNFMFTTSQPHKPSVVIVPYGCSSRTWYTTMIWIIVFWLQARYCSRCSFESFCSGCPLPRSTGSEVKLKPGDHVTVSFADPFTADQLAQVTSNLCSDCNLVKIIMPLYTRLMMWVITNRFSTDVTILV